MTKCRAYQWPQLREQLEQVLEIPAVSLPAPCRGMLMSRVRSQLTIPKLTRISSTAAPIITIITPTPHFSSAPHKVLFWVFTWEMLQRRWAATAPSPLAKGTPLSCGWELPSLRFVNLRGRAFFLRFCVLAWTHLPEPGASWELRSSGVRNTAGRSRLRLRLEVSDNLGSVMRGKSPVQHGGVHEVLFLQNGLSKILPGHPMNPWGLSLAWALHLLGVDSFSCPPPRGTCLCVSPGVLLIPHLSLFILVIMM